MTILRYKTNNNALLLCAVIFILLFKTSATQAIAQPKSIDLVSAPWVNGARDDGTGLYLDIMRLVYEPLGIKVKNKITNYSHSVALVKREEKDAWLGSYLSEEANIIYPKWHFDADVVCAFYKKSSGVDWQGATSLIGKNVGWVKGYNYNKYIDVNFNIKEFNTRKQAIKALENGELDFLLEAHNEMDNEFITHHLDETQFSRHHLMNLNIFLGFADNEKGKMLADIFDLRFALLLKSGEIKKLYNKWNWPIYPFTQLCSFADTAMINC